MNPSVVIKILRRRRHNPLAVLLKHLSDSGTSSELKLQISKCLIPLLSDLRKK